MAASPRLTTAIRRNTGQLPCDQRWWRTELPGEVHRLAAQLGSGTQEGPPVNIAVIADISFTSFIHRNF
ncbi:hypothetical protein GCM10009828_087920 [Actinoplanes couchii]|uniref:Uncharacterized protein n=1 Tax=Actinoplanes couchii TaxID=403638 RepID=A0ABQ3XRI0_9ACTN|nr:hypothetical protein Aco03nite_094740 [Actinoplanes couchii]